MNPLRLLNLFRELADAHDEVQRLNTENAQLHAACCELRRRAESADGQLELLRMKYEFMLDTLAEIQDLPET